MAATNDLHALGQSIWLDNITRRILDDGTLARYITDLSVTGLTSNPTIFQKAIAGGGEYDASIRNHREAGLAGEDLFFELAIEDLTRAAGLFETVHEATDGVDGWVSLEVSPTLADDAAGTIAQARHLHAKAACRNLFIKVPGTTAGLEAIEELTFAGVPVNVTLLFSVEQYLEAARAHRRGVERRLEAGLDPVVESVASLFISRWDRASESDLPDELRNTLGVAVGAAAYAAYRAFLAEPASIRVAERGAHAQRLLFASTGTKDPELPDTMYVDGLAAPDTVNTMPENTLLAYHDHGSAPVELPTDGTEATGRLAAIARAGVDLDALATTLQVDGAAAFVESWNALLADLESKVAALAT